MDRVYESEGSIPHQTDGPFTIMEPGLTKKDSFVLEGQSPVIAL